MGGQENRTNWVYVLLGVAMLGVVAAGFYWMNQQAAQRSSALAHALATAPGATASAAAGQPASEVDRDMEWAQAIVKAVDDGFRASEERSAARMAETVRLFEQLLDERMEATEARTNSRLDDLEERLLLVLESRPAEPDRAAEVAPPTDTAAPAPASDLLAQAVVYASLSGALELYRRDMGHYPTAAEGGLQALLDAPDVDTAEYWAGPYLPSPIDLRDPWGNEFHYETEELDDSEAYALYSPGPDGAYGTADDVAPWRSR